MENLFKLMLMAPLMLGLSFSSVSCSDDGDNDDPQLTPEQREQQAQAQHDRFWDVLTTNYANYTNS